MTWLARVVTWLASVVNTPQLLALAALALTAIAFVLSKLAGDSEFVRGIQIGVIILLLAAVSLLMAEVLR